MMYSKALFVFLTAVCVNIPTTQSAINEDTKTGKSFVNEATSLGSISSRFLDLGGVISQLFSGFNQGTAGGSSGLNFPPNSQFYPGVLAQGFNTIAAAGDENKRSNLKQGSIRGSDVTGGFQSQQEPNRPSPSLLNFNSQTGQNQRQLSQQVQDLAQILNIQNNNGPQKSERNSRFQRSEIVNSYYPRSQHDYPFGSQYRRFEGTLDDFFTDDSSINNDGFKDEDHKIVFPDDEEEVTMKTSTKNAVWGKPVVIPSTTISSDTIFFVDDKETPSQRECVQRCPTTSEYNPVCGSDSVTYFNPGRLLCARNCGINVHESRRGTCRAKLG